MVELFIIIPVIVKINIQLSFNGPLIGLHWMLLDYHVGVGMMSQRFMSIASIDLKI